jgi:mRNA interferase MazF
MGSFTAGDVIIVPFPFSDLTSSKRRPALVLCNIGRNDFVLCQITSKQYSDPLAVSLTSSDFIEGELLCDSFVRPGKLFTANQSIFIGRACRIHHSKQSEVVQVIIDLLNGYLQ